LIFRLIKIKPHVFTIRKRNFCVKEWSWIRFSVIVNFCYSSLTRLLMTLVGLVGFLKALRKIRFMIYYWHKQRSCKAFLCNPCTILLPWFWA
jgi:hypothetical protein